MSRLEDQIRRRRGGDPTAAVDAPGAGRQAILDELRRRMAGIEGRAPEPRAARSSERELVWRFLPGEVVETDLGPVQVLRRDLGPGRRHGRVPLADLAFGPGLAALAEDESIGRLSRERALFIDTETTGLSGGTGTLPFLVGLGRFGPDGGFAVEQILCREPCEERAQLLVLADRLAGADALVTFNGRAFDLPIVNTRFVMNRMRNPAAGLPHLDLLLAARRVFGRRLSDRSLGSLESAVLGFSREGDIPGHAIPGVYAAFLRGGPVEPLLAVLEHNLLDIAALAALAAVLERMYSDPSAVDNALDHLGLARAALSAGEEAIAEAHLERAGAAIGNGDRVQAFSMAAAAASRRGDHARAAACWREVIGIDPSHAAAHLALAKHLEHRERNPALALRHARLTAAAEGEARCERRVARLERRLARRGRRETPARGGAGD